MRFIIQVYLKAILTINTPSLGATGLQKGVQYSINIVQKGYPKKKPAQDDLTVKTCYKSFGRT